jgi:ubiquinone/menaquinone biosynthesis C-methylase UbiE
VALYDRIGVGYDTTRQADPYLLSRLIHHLQPRASGCYLDIGSGTGNYTIAMHQAGVPIRGLELSPTMLARAKEKAPHIAWHNGRAEAIPFASGSFDGATCTFVHHHMADPVAAFREVYRVLKPNARFVILNGTAEQARHYWLNEYFPRMMTEKAIAPYQRFVTVDLLKSAGFRIECEEKYDVTPDLKDFFLCCGKLQPERYLDPRIRSGISSFANAPDQDEIARGVQRIANDIVSRRIDDVIRKYAWDGGDYMFTVAER